MLLKLQNGREIYSDGDETELEMLKIATDYPGDLSEDFIANNSKYTINNTFSSVRQNILNWYPFKDDAEILEVGAGMGSITGLLCDKAKNVTSIELNELRAEVIRVRHAERKNLTVISEDINCWDSGKKFDYIVMIGVLEYAGIFTEGSKPFEAFLNNVSKFLKEDGIILCAIENRFGLKYWCGASEDHLSKPFVGIEGYKEAKTPVTFSKFQLKEMLDSVGLDNNRFYYILPDYKFPQGIYTDQYMPSYQELEKIPFTYSRGSMLGLNEKDIYKDILENKNLDFFSNSYLFEASQTELSKKQIVFATGRSECKKEYRIITTIDNEGNVRKLPAHGNAKLHIKNTFDNEVTLKSRGLDLISVTYENNSLNSKFYNGLRADKIFEEYLFKNDLLSICKFLDLLKENLLKSSPISKDNINILIKNGIGDKNKDYGPVLLNGYIDMTFYNAFFKDNKLIFFDQEWSFENVPLKFILYYAMKIAFYRSKVKTIISFKSLLEYVGIGDEKEDFDKLENFIWSTVLNRQGDLYGEDDYCNQYNENLTVASFINSYEQKIANKDGHIEQLLQSERNLQSEIFKYEDDLIDIKLKLVNKETEFLDTLSKLEQTQIESQQIQIESRQIQIESQQIQTDLKYTIEELRKVNLEFIESVDGLENDKVELINENRELFNTTDEMKAQIDNKCGHIELLLESDRELERIKNSRSWRYMGYIWRVKDCIIPQGSKRRLLVKVTVRFIKHPIQFIRKFTPSRIRNFFYYLRKEGAISVSKRFDECLVDTNIEHTKIEVINVIEDVKKKSTDYKQIVFSKENNPVVSIIIPVFNQFEYTYNCLTSILQNSGDITYEIIIANDCSTDLTKEIENIISNVIVINNDVNLRFLKNCNNAAKYARGKYILFLNNDTQVQENWLVPLVNLIESDEKIGMVGSKLVYPDGRLQEAGGILWKDGSAWNYGNKSDPNDPEYNYVKEVDYISGASIMISKELWDEIGGFDETFAPAYCEDCDLAFEVRKHGYQVMYQPLSVVVHFEGVSNGTDTSSGQKSYQIVNQKNFYEKWKDTLEVEHFSNGQDAFVAKDRSGFLNRILVIDHYVPHYDQDAGGKCTFMYIKLFINMGMKVTFIGDNFSPHQPYTTELQQLGVEVLYGNYYFNNWKSWLKENAHYFDYAYLNRPHISIKYIDLLKANSTAKIIYFGHDLHYLREYRQYLLENDPFVLASSEHWKKIEFELFSKADVIYAVGSYEQKILQDEFPHKSIRNIPVYIYENMKTVINTEFEERKDIIFVGGFGHPPNVDGVLWFANEIFPEIVEKYPDIKWYIVGSKPQQNIIDLQNKNIKVTGFISDEELNSLYSKCRMAVVPLRVGAGVKGKVVEAIYNGIPLVTTPIGAEGLSLKENAFIVAEANKSMIGIINSLYTDFDKLKELSENCNSFIEKYFTEEIAKSIVELDIKIRGN